MVKKFNVIQTIDTNDLVKRAAYHVKIEKIEIKIFIKLTKESFAEKLKQVNLSSKIDIADFWKKSRF